MPDGGPSAFLKERAFLAADEIDATVEALCVETRGENLPAVHFTALATACEILLTSADLFTALELGAVAAQEARRVERKFSHYRCSPRLLSSAGEELEEQGVRHWVLP